MKRLIILIIAAVFLIIGCGKKAPAEANMQLKEALTALTMKRYEKFIGSILPAQRKKATSLEQWPFFQHIINFKIDNEYDTVVSDNAAKIAANLFLNDSKTVYFFIRFQMKKDNGRWYVDLDETIRQHINGTCTHVFDAWELYQ